MRDVIEPGRDLGHVDRNHARPAAAPAAGEAKEAGAGGQQQQGAGQAQVQQDKPSRSELEAAGPAGAGYPGASEAAATQLAGQAGAACENKAECEDCD